VEGPSDRLKPSGNRAENRRSTHSLATRKLRAFRDGLIGKAPAVATRALAAPTPALALPAPGETAEKSLAKD
jgi:hypothetical protein